MTENTQQQVREFYDQIGWSIQDDGLYQNARYEDLRPVVREYIHRCHLRVNRHLSATGKFLLDAGSGPVQYPEYLTYSERYRYRVCADISITALTEARKRLGEKGLFAVCDVSRLPFKTDVFDGVVSLHTIHHLPPQDHRTAYAELTRVLKAGKTGVVVNGWSNPRLMQFLNKLAGLAAKVLRLFKKKKNQAAPAPVKEQPENKQPTGTFVIRPDAQWLKEQLQGITDFEIFTWRSVSTGFTRQYIREKFAGKFILQIIYWLEERFPHYFGVNGQYPLIVIRKPERRA